MDEELLKALKEMLRDELKPVNDRLDRIDNRLDKVENRLDRVESKVDKNTLILEEVRKDIKTLAELHEAHKEQNERSFDKANALTLEKSDLVEAALANTTKELNGLKDSIEVLTEAVGKHEMDIRILKKRPV